jgi:hypothetical protein
MKLIKAHLQWLVFCISAIVFFAGAAARVVRASNDFVPVYTGARCLLHGCNPYRTTELEQQFYQAGGHQDELPSWQIDVPVYPPSTFLALAPLGLLRFPAARMAWFLLNSSLFVIAAALMTSLTPRLQRWPATIMVSFALLTGSIVLILGQPASFAISLLAIGCYLLLRGRWLLLGAILLALSLAVKPQIGGLLVVYLLVYLLGKRSHWGYAAAALTGALGLLLCAGFVLQQQPRSAAWATTLRGNLAATLGPGGSADPRPENQQSVGDINLQAVTSVYLGNARTFNLAAYSVFLLLLAAWGVAVVRAHSPGEPPYLALAALVVLTLMPVYHRFYDTRLLLLTVPALAMVFARRRLLGVALCGMTALTLISTQYRVQAYLLQHKQFATVLVHKIWFLLLLRQQNLELLLLFALYLVAMQTMRSGMSMNAEAATAPEPAVAAW